MRYQIHPKPYKVVVGGKTKWVPKVHVYVHDKPGISIDRVVTWKKNYLFDTEEEARRFITDAIDSLERINIQLKGKQVAALKAIAEESGQTLTEVIRQALNKYIKEK